ncbi:MAG TPA: glycosyltransferase [Pyrinomonadaceae bacterium]|nr:glycosyltransferase [Pyrinomonadaceae bacterium]
MRIMYCIPTLEHGGAERQLSYLALELARKGHEIHVVFLRDGANLGRMRAGGVATHRLPAGGNHDPKIFLGLLRLIRKIRPDIIQTSLPQMDVLGGAAALTTGTRWVLKESSSAPAYPAHWKSSLRASLTKRADAIVSNSQAGDAYWGAKGGAPPRYVIPNGLPLDEIAAAQPAPAPADLRFEPDEKLLLYAGRMDSGKNVETLIVALSRVANEVPLTALLCGDGVLKPRLEGLAAELGLKHRVVFSGYVSNLWALMKRADAFAFLSRFEGCPNVVLEAMACGCPLIVSDIPAHREILDDRSACFVDPDEPEAIAEALTTTLLFGDAARARAVAAQAKVAERTIGGMAERYEQLYLGVIESGSA